MVHDPSKTGFFGTVKNRRYFPTNLIIHDKKTIREFFRSERNGKYREFLNQEFFIEISTSYESMI